MTTMSKAQIEACPERPPIPLVHIENIPECMRERDQWVLWRYVRTGDRWTKVLLSATRCGGKLHFENAKSNDKDTWMEWEEATFLCVMAEGTYRIGLGFCPDYGDPFTVIDLDDCRNRDTGALTPAALEYVRLLDSYTEVSPSGTGLKIFLRGTKPGTRCVNRQLKVEIYSHAHFMAVTGNRLIGSPEDIQDRQEQLTQFYTMCFPAPVPNPAPLPSPARSSSSDSLAQRPLPEIPRERVMERARRYIAKVGPAISGQHGHNHTFYVACILVRRFDLSQHDAMTVISEWNATCQPPWSDAELRHKLDGADKASGPRGDLLRSDYEYKSTPEEDAAADALIARLRAETEATIASRPPVPPPEPPQPTVVTPEDAARALRYSRINCIRNCCPRPEFVGLDILDTGSPYEIERRCGRCPACLAERVEVKWEVIRQKLRAITDAGGNLYYRVRPAAEWGAVRKQYDRADEVEGKGFFHFKFLPEGFAPDDLAGELPFYLLTSVDIGAPISLGDALCDIRRCLEAAVARTRPRQRLYTASDTWAEARLPKCEPKCKFETTLDPIPPADRAEIAAAFDAQVQVKVVPTDAGDTMVQTTYATIRADGWTDTLRAWYWRCRIAGRMLDEAAFSGSTDAAADRGDVVEGRVVHPSQDSPPRPKIEVDVQLVE